LGNNIKLIGRLFILLISFVFLTSSLKVGELAPNFKLPTQDQGKEIQLSDLKRSYVILYFYPMDNTIFCSKQAQKFNKFKAEFAKLDAIILGVSKDDVKSHKEFSDKYALTFDLLADTKGEVREKYNISSAFERTTYLIDKEGKIINIWPNASFSSNASDVLKFLQEQLLTPTNSKS
jgi:peroxiredoxin Q/BCP